MSVRTPAQAVAWAKTQTTGYKGLCLVFVRSCYGIAAKYGSAAEAWAAAKIKHKTTSTSGIPTGAPVFFSTPATKYGHVALYLGGGKFRTNYSAKGTVVTASLSDPVFAGMTMLGWTGDLNGVTIAGLKAPAASSSSSSADLRKGSAGAAVGQLQREMNRVFPSYANFAVDSVFGDYTVQVVKEFQRRAGITVDGVVGPETRKALAKYGVKL